MIATKSMGVEMYTYASGGGTSHLDQAYGNISAACSGCGEQIQHENQERISWGMLITINSFLIQVWSDGPKLGRCEGVHMTRAI